MPKFEDDSLMPFGKYEGEQMINVPAEYFIYLYENVMTETTFGKGLDVKNYIEENWDVLQEEVNKNK